MDDQFRAGAFDPGEVGPRARQTRLELQRRRLARSRQQEALLARAAVQLTEGGRLLRTRPARALLVQRDRPARERLAGELARRGIDVLGVFADAELAVHVARSAQPELVIVEHDLPDLSAVQVLGSVRQLCAHAHLAALVDGDQYVSAVLAAGATRAFARTASPAEVARDLTALVRQR